MSGLAMTTHIVVNQNGDTRQEFSAANARELLADVYLRGLHGDSNSLEETKAARDVRSNGRQDCVFPRIVGG